MAQKKVLFRRNLFSADKTKPRKVISRSTLKLSAEGLAREFGSNYQTINARIGHQNMTYNIEQGCWISDEIVISAEGMSALKTRRQELINDNNILRVKLDILLEMLTQSNAEGELRKDA